MVIVLLQKLRRFCTVIFGCAGLMFAGQAAAQTISQPLGNRAVETNITGLGQGFVATVTGAVTSIRVRPIGAGTTTLRLYGDVNGSDVPGAIGTPLYSQGGVVLVDGGSVSAGFQEITLTTPLPVIAGQGYSFTFDQASLASGGINPYPDGPLLRQYELASLAIDLAFEVVQETPPTPVPTLSQWAMILFGTILAGGTALYLQRRRLIARA